MTPLFPKQPKPITMPEAKEPLEPPEVVAEETRPEKRKKGRAETIITGELEPKTTGRTLLE